jgi:hypothetical protein
MRNNDDKERHQPCKFYAAPKCGFIWTALKMIKSILQKHLKKWNFF